MCLEEMLQTQLEEGYLYYAASRRRFAVRFASGLRRSVEDGAHRLHEMVRSGVTPPAKASARCRGCSMVELCGPRLTSTKASRYLAEILDALAEVSR
jgi:CRISPR-associated exonuclease Cas4